MKLPSGWTRTVSASIVLASHVLRLVGRSAAEPPGSAHSMMLTRVWGANSELGPTETVTDSPLVNDAEAGPGEMVTVGVGRGGSTGPVRHDHGDGEGHHHGDRRQLGCQTSGSVGRQSVMAGESAVAAGDEERCGEHLGLA